MSKDEKVLLAQYGITTESKIVYVYGQHRYENAKDAIKFAGQEAERAQEHMVASET